MNDWLDYKGSGSSRAYIMHSLRDNINKTLYPAFDYMLRNDIKAKDQYFENETRNANIRLYNANIERRDALVGEYNALTKKLNKKNDFLKTCTDGLTANQNELNALEAKRSATAASKDALTAHQTYATKIYNAQKNIKYFSDKVAETRRDISDITKKQTDIKSEIDKLDSKLKELHKTF